MLFFHTNAAKRGCLVLVVCIVVYIVLVNCTWLTWWKMAAKTDAPSKPNLPVETPFLDFQLEGVNSTVILRKNYSSFTYPRPHFIDPKSEALFYKRDWNKAVLDHVMTAESFYGDVYIIPKGRFEVPRYCGYHIKTNWIKQDGEVKPKNWFKVLVPLVLPDGGTFQHFQDQVLLRLIQVLPIVRTYNATILLHTPRDKILYDLYDRLSITSQIRFYRKEDELYGADYLIISCIRDSLHPMVWRESRWLLGVQLERAVPMADGYVILLTRDGCFNCGRKLLNHDAIVDMLRKRYGESVVKVYKGPKPLKESMDLFGKARIIIGGHGGGFYNLNYAPEKTAVVEFMPTTDDGQTGIPGEQIFFKIASILKQEYWRVAVAPEENKNMRVDIALLEKLLDVVDKGQLSNG